MADPFADLIAANPTAATLHLPATSPSPYDPTATATAPVTEASETALTGLFTHEMESGLSTVYDASFTIRLADLPTLQARSEELKLTVDEVTFNVAKIRKRYWGGVQVGWTLMLTG